MSETIKRIVVIGPESTGKSTLSRRLAAHFETSFADEYARSYLENLNRPYEQKDLINIAKGQRAAMAAALESARNGLVIFDTDLYVLKVWSESKYNSCDTFILEQIAEQQIDFYILTNIDFPWQYDPLREHPEPAMRAHFFKTYLEIVVQSGVPFFIANGSEQQRFHDSVQKIEELAFS
jgi:NadR type nicotinamide-nucleotide adenylyltransferase